MENHGAKTMHQITLSEFARQQGQEKAAAILGVTQGGLSKALRVERQIYVICRDDGSYEGQELRPFPSKKAKPAA
jgi:hypothetical protein